MKPEDAIEQLDAEWDLETGFFGRARGGYFDAAGFDRVISLLESIEQPGEVVNARFVALTWYIPIFMDWQKERCTERGFDALSYTQAANRLETLVVRLLGTP